MRWNWYQKMPIVRSANASPPAASRALRRLGGGIAAVGSAIAGAGVAVVVSMLGRREKHRLYQTGKTRRRRELAREPAAGSPCGGGGSGELSPGRHSTCPAAPRGILDWRIGLGPRLALCLSRQRRP